MVSEDARLTVGLTHEGILVENWTWAPGGNRNTTRLEFSGEYEIAFHNPTKDPVGYLFYYDQSCNCKGKLIPLPNGWNLFNYDLPKGRAASIGFPLTRDYEVRGALATLRPGTDAKWPEDFSALQESQASGPSWLNFTFETKATQRYFVHVEAIRGVNMSTDPPEPLYLTPLVEVKAPSPAVPPVGSLLLIGLAVVAARRARSD